MSTNVLPPGWTVTQTLEHVADPNVSLGPPGPFHGAGFTRWTYICRDSAGSYVCSSGAREDCEAQALSMAQQRMPLYDSNAWTHA